MNYGLGEGKGTNGGKLNWQSKGERRKECEKKKKEK